VQGGFLEFGVQAEIPFVLLDKQKREKKGPAAGERIQSVPKIISVNRRNPSRLELKALRGFTWTCQDALEQFDKLRSVFDSAAYTGEYFQNRALFSDYFLRERLKADAAWQNNPSEMFGFVRDLLRNADANWRGEDKETLQNELLEPLFKKLGFKPSVNRPSKTTQTEPDYILKGSDNGKLTAAFVYAWDRWLDGPDLNDSDTPDENPGACVVTALDQGIAEWIIVTNGRLWRLYSRQAPARATNFYEVDLIEALTASGDTDPNEAFRYWSLFFRPDAFRQIPEATGCWLDTILHGRTGGRTGTYKIPVNVMIGIAYSHRLRIIPHRGRTKPNNPAGPIASAGAPEHTRRRRRSARPQPSAPRPRRPDLDKRDQFRRIVPPPF